MQIVHRTLSSPIARLASLALLLAGATVAPVRSQSLVNPGFEGAFKTVAAPAPGSPEQISGAIGAGWNDNTDWTPATIHYAKDATVVHSGMASQEIIADSGFAQFAQYITFTKSGDYKAGIWLKAKSPTWVTVMIREGGAPYKAFASASVKIDTTWTNVTCSGVVDPGGAGLFVIIGGRGTAAEPGATIWLDDATLAPATQSAELLIPAQIPIPAAYFGMNANHMGDRPGYAWPALAFGTFRSWDSGIIWPNIETASGVFDWSLMDSKLAAAQRHGAQFLFTMGLTPRWAAPSSPNTYSGVARVPDNIKDYSEFLTAVATRYKGKVHAYEPWNEPDGEGFFHGSPAQIAMLEREMASAIKPIDPSAIICTAPISSISQIHWFDEYLAAGGGKHADVIAYHLYTDRPEDDIQSVQLIRSVLRTHGIGSKPIWNTESGLQIEGTTAQHSAAFVARVLIVDWAAGISRSFWYAYDNTSYYGLDVLNPDHTTNPAELSPSGVAYKLVRNWLLGSVMKSCARDINGTWVAALKRRTGNSGWIVWNPGGDMRFRIPSAWSARAVTNLAGTTATLSSAVVSVSESPIFLTR